MSSARQAVHRGDSFTGLGNRPDFTPCHQLVFPSGITLSTCGKRKNPVSGILCILNSRPVHTLLVYHNMSVMSRKKRARASLLANDELAVMPNKVGEIVPKWVRSKVVQQ